MSCVLLSPAKINLSLRILGKRQDGYHELLTEMVMISLGDRMEFFRTDNLCDVLEVSGRVVDGNPDDNLILRAIRLFRESRKDEGNPCYWKVKLEKNIPVGAGLGGGSSNAAAALWGMNVLSGNRLSRMELMEIGARLGSDVPFFLGGPRSVASGRGEKIHPFPPLPVKTIVLWNPLVPLSTSRVYGGLAASPTNSLTDLETLPKISSLLSEDAGGNDLEPVAMSILPIIRKVKDALLVDGAGFSQMSGSGPTVFGIFDDPGRAKSACQDLQEQFGGWTGVFETLSASPFVSE